MSTIIPMTAKIVMTTKMPTLEYFFSFGAESGGTEPSGAEDKQKELLLVFSSGSNSTHLSIEWAAQTEFDSHALQQD